MRDGATRPLHGEVAEAALEEVRSARLAKFGPHPSHLPWWKPIWQRNREAALRKRHWALEGLTQEPQSHQRRLRPDAAPNARDFSLTPSSLHFEPYHLRSTNWDARSPF